MAVAKASQDYLDTIKTGLDPLVVIGYARPGHKREIFEIRKVEVIE